MPGLLGERRAGLERPAQLKRWSHPGLTLAPEGAGTYNKDTKGGEIPMGRKRINSSAQLHCRRAVLR